MGSYALTFAAGWVLCEAAHYRETTGRHHNGLIGIAVGLLGFAVALHFGFDNR